MSEDILKKVDDHIRSSNLSEASIILGTIDPKALKRASLAQYANLSRRLGHTDDAIKVLRPYVRPKSKDPQSSTVDERMEYAMALIKLGALNEGVKILEPVDGDKYPNKFLYVSFAEITRWNYPDAASYLEKFVKHSQVDDYSKITAKINLFSCYIVMDVPEKAGALLEDLLRITSAEVAKRHRRNVLSMAAQFYVVQQNFEKASEFMGQAIEMMGVKTSLDLMLLKKWDIVLRIHQAGANTFIFDEINQLRKAATDIRNYEVVREADYLKAIYFKDEKLLEYLYMGTPFNSYKEKIVRNYEKVYQKDFPIWNSYRWALSEAGHGPEIVAAGNDFLNVKNGDNSFSDLSLRPGLLGQRLLSLLTKDFYRPLGLFMVHDELFNENYFSPNSTPRKIYQMIYRLNCWFSEASTPLQIETKNNNFSLLAKQPLALIIGENKMIDIKLREFSDNIARCFNDAWFSRSEVAIALNLPTRTATKWLGDACKDGFVEKQGAGPKTRFRILNRS